MFELEYLDRRVREIEWEMYLLKRMSLHNTKRYKRLDDEFNHLVSKLRKLRGLAPYDPEHDK